MQEDTVVSGTIFTFNLKVRSDAPFGTYGISGSWSLNTGSGSCSVTVTVACEHNYGPANKIDLVNHQSVCTYCGEVKNEPHNFGSGEIIKESTCKEMGLKRFTCSACGQVKEEETPVNNNHKFSSWTKADENKHTHSCSVCGKKETASHNWNSGTIIKNANCTEKGEKKLSCNSCGATKNVVIPIAEHNYGKAEKISDSSHVKICKDCNKEVTESHSFSSNLSHDSNWHYQECSACSFKKNQEAHKPGAEATETTAQICTVCERILQPAGEHVHKFFKEWECDETGHYYSCESCNEKESAAPHEYENDCDAECNVCLFVREPEHKASKELKSNSEGHYYECENCGEKLNFAEHISKGAATITSAEVCTECDYEIAPIVPHDHKFDESGTYHSHFCSCGEAYSADLNSCEICKPFPWWIICIVEAFAFGGIIAFILLKNKKREKIAEDSFEEHALEDEVYEDTEFSEDDNFEAFTESEDGPDVKSFDKEKNSLKGSKHFRK